MPGCPVHGPLLDSASRDRTVGPRGLGGPAPRPAYPGESIPRTLEDLVLGLPVELKKTSDLSEFGAQAIHAALRERGGDALPSGCTIGWILERRGGLDGQYRLRRRPGSVIRAAAQAGGTVLLQAVALD